MVTASRLLHRRPFSSFGSRVAHLIAAPTLHDLYSRAALFSDSPAAVASAIVGEAIDYTSEYAVVKQRLHEQASATPSNYPDYFTIEDGTAALVYALVRHARPELAVEMGVADGRSTQVILSALDANGVGRLVSVDMKDDVGGAATGHPRWSLRVHSRERSDTQLRALLTEIGHPDLFFHDAGHSYYEQLGDYLAAWENMDSGGLLISDDVDHTWAFLDIARLADAKPFVLMDRRKAVGALIRP